MDYQERMDREVNSIINGVFQIQSKRIPLKKVEYWEIDVYEIEKQVKKHLGLTVEIIPDDELHNGYSPVTMISAEDHTKDIEEWKNGRQWSMSLNSWIEHLAFLNVIPEGDFLVDHSW